MKRHRLDVRQRLDIPCRRWDPCLSDLLREKRARRVDAVPGSLWTGGRWRVRLDLAGRPR